MKAPLVARLRDLCVAFAVAAPSLAAANPAAPQDDILVYGNSIIDDWVIDYLRDIIVQSGAPTPNIQTFIGNNLTTTSYLANQALITTALPAGETWEAMVIQGGTVETTFAFGNDPAMFHSNMLALASAYFAHSPQGLFIGHETGADHPVSNRYPSWFPDPATWLAFSQVAYESARVAITAAHPSSPAPRTAPQGTVFASTAGYPRNLFTNDEHHHSLRGQILDAMLQYQAIYGGRLRNLNVDFTQNTPLVTRLIADGVDVNQWNRLVGFADRSVDRTQRSMPGTDHDFQLRVSVNSTVVNLCSHFSATAGDTLYVRPFSPLDATEMYQAAVHMQLLPTGTLPLVGTVPGAQIHFTQSRALAGFVNLTGGASASPIPAGLAGNTMWLQAISRAPSGSSTYPFVMSDGKIVNIQ